MMAGYIFSLDSEHSLIKCINDGVYSTNLSNPGNNLWKIHHEGTFADYLSMKKGDNVYFFINRKIYGIGRLVEIDFDCKFLNYPNADLPTIQLYDYVKNQMLMNDSDANMNNRIICTFEPSPEFFMNGIDMDDVLSSNPYSFRMLRAFWKVSFIKVDDEENKALKDIILKRNEEYITGSEGTHEFNPTLQQSITFKLNEQYELISDNILKYSSQGNVIRHEMAIEAHLVECLTKGTQEIFGKWDYISHQVIASPFKPIDYMDKMDIFGYNYIPGFETISKYLVIEVKKGMATNEAVDQVMKYVDWINQEYAYGEYYMIEAFIVAYDFTQDVINYKNEVCKRNYIRGRRPTKSDVWSNVRLVKYSYNDSTCKLEFEELK